MSEVVLTPDASPTNILTPAASPAAAPPPPHLVYFSVDGLLDSVESGSIAPLRGRWLAALGAGDTLVRRQELPAAAFWTAEELRETAAKLGDDFGVLFVALSYRWLTKEHPDPDGFHVSTVASVARLYLGDAADDGRARHSPLRRAFEKAGLLGTDFALFWDFCSLHQAPRTPAEQALFRRGLRCSNIWYGHQSSHLWMQTELPPGFDGASYHTSGWCAVEAALSAVVKAADRRLDLTKRTPRAMEHYGGDSVVDEYRLDTVCSARAPPPPSPEMLQRVLETEKVFTARADVGVVAAMYRDFFYAVSGSTASLSFRRVGWEAHHLDGLLAVLPHFVALTALDVSHNYAITVSGAGTLVRAVMRRAQSEGSAPLLSLNLDGSALPIQRLAGAAAAPAACEHIDLSSCGQGLRDRSAAAIAQLIPQNRHLRSLDVRMGAIGPDGAALLTSTVCDACPSLATFGSLPLADLRAGTPPARLNLSNAALMLPEVLVLARFLPGCTSLEELDLSYNGVGIQGAQALAGAIAQGAPRLRCIDLRANPLEAAAARNPAPRWPFISHADYSPPAPFISYALGPYATALEGEEEDVKGDVRRTIAERANACDCEVLL